MLKILLYFFNYKIYSIYLRDLLYEFICSSNIGRTRQEINEYMYIRMNGTIENKNSKVRTALTYLNNQDLIINIGSDTKSIWRKK